MRRPCPRACARDPEQVTARCPLPQLTCRAEVMSVALHGGAASAAALVAAVDSLGHCVVGRLAVSGCERRAAATGLPTTPAHTETQYVPPRRTRGDAQLLLRRSPAGAYGRAAAPISRASRTAPQERGCVPRDERVLPRGGVGGARVVRSVLRPRRRRAARDGEAVLSGGARGERCVRVCIWRG